MKKTLIVALLVAAGISSQGQGLVIYSSSTQNTSTNNTLPVLGSTANGKIQGVNGYYFALFYSANPITTVGTTNGADTTGNNYAFDNSSGLSLVTQSYAGSTATAGRFAAINGNSDSSVAVPGIASGSTAYFIVVGWSANLGSTISQLQTSLGTPGTSGFLGESVASGGLILGNGANGGSQPDTALFGTSAPFVQGFTLGSFITPVPEPGTMALAALSGASLLLFRRRK